MRPIFIVAEPEPDQALSVRKLVIETAKFNVITAHDVDELMESVQKFKNVNAVILHSGMGGGVNLEDTIKEIREVVGDKPVIALSPSGSTSPPADHTLSSHDPNDLVELLRRLFGDPRKMLLEAGFAPGSSNPVE